MTPATELLHHAELLGFTFRMEDGKLKATLPDEPEADALLEQIRANREAFIRLLSERDEISPMPHGVELVSWQPKEPPIAVTRYAIVCDTHLFVRSTLDQLAHALAWERGDENARWLAGHRSSRELMDYLEQVGCKVRIEEEPCRAKS